MHGKAVCNVNVNCDVKNGLEPLHIIHIFLGKVLNNLRIIQEKIKKKFLMEIYFSYWTIGVVRVLFQEDVEYEQVMIME